MKMRKLVLVILSLLIFSCNSSNNDKPLESVFSAQKISPTWSSLRLNIFGSKCLQCHNSSRAEARINLES